MVAPKTLPQRREFLADPQLARVDQAREDLSRTIAMCPFLRGRLVSVTFAANTRKVVRHGLGVAAACLLIRQNYATAASKPALTEDADQTTNCDAKQQLAMQASTACSVDLWFYSRASVTIDASQGQSL